jgi:uncharacterized protein (TIGR00375 family)
MQSYITDKNKYSIADLHIHGRYAISTSKELTPKNLLMQMEVKGVDVIGTGDFLHSRWREEFLPFVDCRKVIPTTEISLHFNNHNRKTAIHLILVFSSIETGENIAKRLLKISPVDRIARPDIFMNAREFCHTIWEIDSRCAIVPAHIFTPYFGALGSRGMYDLEVFGDCIKAVETGISADIEMCMSVKPLQKLNFVSFSDAHSLETLGREATIVEKGDVCDTITAPVATIECHPELGKYHLTGHRKCGYFRTENVPGLDCPVCGAKMKRGVADRLDVLDKSDGARLMPESVKIVPLSDILMCSGETAGKTAKQKRLYQKAIETIGNELHILLFANQNELAKCFDDKTVNLILKARSGSVKIKPGYDGVYGQLE